MEGLGKHCARPVPSREAWSKLFPDPAVAAESSGHLGLSTNSQEKLMGISQNTAGRHDVP